MKFEFEGKNHYSMFQNDDYKYSHKNYSKNYNQNFQFPNGISSYYNPNNQNSYINPNEEIMKTLKYVSDNYPNLITINNNNMGLSSQVYDQAAPRFYVIKSFTEEDIHKVCTFLFFSQLNTVAGPLLGKEIKSSILLTMKPRIIILIFFYFLV